MSIDARCIQLASNGDREAQRVIYETLVERVHRLVLRIVGPSDADDVTQNLFLHLFAKLSSFKHEAEFTTWVHRLAVNEALQHIRRVRRHPTVQLTQPMQRKPEAIMLRIGKSCLKRLFRESIATCV